LFVLYLVLIPFGLAVELATLLVEREREAMQA
jgi:hypothetical protein